MRRFAPTFALVLAASGCYTYTPIAVAKLAPDMTVRLEVAGVTETRQVEGRVFGVDGTSVSLFPETRPGIDRSEWTVPLSDVRSVDQRRFNATRTLAIAGAGAAVGIAALFLAENNPGDTRGPGGGGDFDLVPILRALLSGGR